MVCVQLVVVCVRFCTHESAVLCDGCGTDCRLSVSSVVSDGKGDSELVCIVILLAYKASSISKTRNTCVKTLDVRPCVM